jgi:hypothetical protein
METVLLEKKVGREEAVPDLALCLLEFAATIHEHCTRCPDRDEVLALLAVRKRMERFAVRLVTEGDFI